jgi:hypothetical protein
MKTLSSRQALLDRGEKARFYPIKPFLRRT